MTQEGRWCGFWSEPPHGADRSGPHGRVALRGRAALTSGSVAGPGRVHCTQAIEQMLNARYWPRLFFREQDPKPISYFLTDCGVVV